MENLITYIAIISAIIAILTILNSIVESKINDMQNTATNSLINSHYEMSKGIAMDEVTILEFFNQLGENKSYPQIRESEGVKKMSSLSVQYLKNANESLQNHFIEKNKIIPLNSWNSFIKISLVLLSIINLFLTIMFVKR